VSSGKGGGGVGAFLSTLNGDCCIMSPTIRFILLNLHSLTAYSMLLPSMTSPMTSIPVFATLPRICLPIHFTCGVTNDTKIA